ncbi:cytochrome P450 [Coprinopsis sp. MPI-PUGE-AT-0042]|nr:cytochrome P450 [Coprinopsis sp. MPI-PUGE-AT-0042]
MFQAPELSALQALDIPLLTVLVWWTLRRVFRRNPLALILGPKSESFFLGESRYLYHAVPYQTEAKGHIAKVFDGKGGFQFHEGVVDEHDQVAKLAGLFGSTMLLVSDPKALYHIFVKDQDVIWDEGPNVITSNKAVFGPSLTASLGYEHKRQRKLPNTVFSANHLRGMATIFDDITSKLANTLSDIAGEDKKEVEVFDWVTRGAPETIGQSGFGYSFDALTEDAKPHPFAASLKVLLRLLTDTMSLQVLVLPLVRKYNIGGRRIQRFVMANLTWGPFRRIFGVVEVMHQTSLEIYQTGKQSLDAGGRSSSKDILSILLRANMASEPKDKLADDEAIAQISILTFGGMDTTSSAVVRLLCLLSEKQDVQTRLRAEIREAKELYGELSYDQLVALPYLDAVYPPGPLLGRHAKKDTTIPLLTPIRGTDGAISARYLYQEMAERASHMLTFAGGGRSCIGFKFAELQMKSMIFHLIDRLKFSLTADKKILWKFGGILGPGVDLEKLRPELPLILERAE